MSRDEREIKIVTEIRIWVDRHTGLEHRSEKYLSSRIQISHRLPYSLTADTKARQRYSSSNELTILSRVRHLQNRSDSNLLANVQGGSNLTGTDGVLTSHSLSRSYLNHLVHRQSLCKPQNKTLKLRLHLVLRTSKVHLIEGHEDPQGEQTYSSTLSLTSALDKGGCLTPRPGRIICSK
jgi:hypothetical protein